MTDAQEPAPPRTIEEAEALIDQHSELFLGQLQMALEAAHAHQIHPGLIALLWAKSVGMLIGTMIAPADRETMRGDCRRALDQTLRQHGAKNRQGHPWRPKR